MKSLKATSDEWSNAIYWSSSLFGIFIIKKCVEISLTSFGTVKYDFVMKTVEIFSFLSLMNISVTIWLCFLLLIILAIISSKTINTLRSLSALYSSIFCGHAAYHLNI